ncbi:hypothetical protein D3C80_1488050 [compost metagenome]
MLGLLQQVGGIDEFVIEGWILAHQDHIQFAQRDVALGAQFEPVLRVIEYVERAQAGTCLALGLVKVLLLHIEERPAARLGGQQHGQRAVLLEGDLGDGVHDNAEANAHGGISP